MENHFIKVTGAEQFTDLLSRSQKQPIVIFKHSTTCPISAAAYNEMEQLAGEVVLVEVQRARELSREDAYVLSSLCVDLKISEIVDAGEYVVSALLPLAVFRR